MAALDHDRDEGSGVQGGEDSLDLDNNILFEVLRRVDPVTLATASCVNSDFRSVSEEEGLWEKLCNERWPSTKDSQVKSILASVGGYREVYAHCYPSLVNKEQYPTADRFSVDNVHEPHEQELEKASDCSPSDFISIVDVLYDDRAVFSRTVEGVPGADDVQGWFSTCPFRVDLLRQSESHGEGQNINVTESDLHFMISGSSLLKGDSLSYGSKLWKTLYDKMRVSWILINKKTKQMANLASWKPLGGFRHWLCDEDFLLRFGSVLPGLEASCCSDLLGRRGAVQCNISLVCSVSFTDIGVGETTEATLRLTELSLQLEHFEGALANGKESVAILHKALSCPKSTNRDDVVDSYHRYLEVRSELKARNTRDDGCLNVGAALASGISSCLFMFWLVGFLIGS